MVSRRHRARFFSKAASAGFSRLTLKKRKVPPFRYVLLILITLGSMSVWSFWGGSLMASINPDLRMQFHLMTPALDAWITPPDYTGLPPIMIATPAGSRYDGNVIDVPIGSTITAHLADGDGGAPDLLVNGETTPFTPDAQGGFEIAATIRSGDLITVRHGWHEMDAWKVHVLADHAPKVAFTEPPSVTDRKSVRLSYEASDDYGVASVVAHIAPRVSMPHADAKPVDIVLASPDTKDLKRVSFEDLTAYPWAGSPVQIQLVVTDVAGHTTQTEPIDFTVPARVFMNPVARALIEERIKLRSSPADENVRNEVANVMAGVAHVPGAYHGDQVVLMSLRSGAVRLVLNHTTDINNSIDEILWEAAVRIEDGVVGVVERRLREAQSELADAIDRNASGPEIQTFVDRLHDALAAYISALSSRTVQSTPPQTIAPHGSQSLTQATGTQTNMLAPKDMEHMIQNIRDSVTSGSADDARDALLKLEQKVESYREPSPSFTEEMQRRAKNLRYPEGAHDSAEHDIPNF